MDKATQLITLQEQNLSSFDDSKFFHSLTLIDNFFNNIDDAIKKLDDDNLLQLFSAVNQMGNRTWFTRCLILEEIENRTKESLQKKTLSRTEFETGVAKAVDLARSTAYEDLQILKAVRASGLTPRLDRAFYKTALLAPNFKEAIEYAEEQHDSLGGKYSSRNFSRWVAMKNGEGEKDPLNESLSFELSKVELNVLINALSNLLTSGIDLKEEKETAISLLTRLQSRWK